MWIIVLELFLDMIAYWLCRLGRSVFPILFVGLALLARWLLEPALQGKLPYAFFYVAIILTAWCTDIWETILAVVLGWVAAEWFFVEPRWSLLISGTAGWVGVGVPLTRRNRAACGARPRRSSGPT